MKLPVKHEKNGLDISVGDIDIQLNNLSVDIDAFRPRNEILQ